MEAAATLTPHRDGRRDAPSWSPARNMHRLGLVRRRRSADVPLSDAGGLNPTATTLLETANFSTAVLVALATTDPLPRCSRAEDLHRTQCWERYVARPSTCHFVLSSSRWTSRRRHFGRKAHNFSLTKSQYLVECSHARQHVLRTVRARCRACTDESPDVFRSGPALRCFVSLSFLRAPSPGKRGRRLCFFRNQSGVVHPFLVRLWDPQVRLPLPRSDPWSWASVLRVKGCYTM